jgi:hypothetical protein
MIYFLDKNFEPSSVVAMTAPMAEELNAAKERICQLLLECKQWQERCNKIETLHSDLQHANDKLNKEKNEALSCIEILEIVRDDMKNAKQALATQLQDAQDVAFQAEEQLAQFQVRKKDEIFCFTHPAVVVLSPGN